MYAWKCWRDTRSRYLTLLIACVLLGVALAGSFNFTYDVNLRGFRFNPPRVPSDVAYAWHMTCDTFGAIAVVLAIVLGLALGGGGLGEELQDGTVSYLVTRPRRRSYFVVVRWGVAVAQLAVFSVVGSLAPFVTLYVSTGYIASAFFLWMGVVCFTFSLLAFALADFCTLLRENVRDGIAIAIGLGVGWLWGIPAIGSFWNLHTLSPIPLLAALKPPMFVPGGLRAVTFRIPVIGLFVSARSDPAWWSWSAAGWIVIALAFMIPAGYFFRRKEV